MDPGIAGRVGQARAICASRQLAACPTIGWALP
jgi:hypothetical protein